MLSFYNELLSLSLWNSFISDNLFNISSKLNVALYTFLPFIGYLNINECICCMQTFLVLCVQWWNCNVIRTNSIDLSYYAVKRTLVQYLNRDRRHEARSHWFGQSLIWTKFIYCQGLLSHYWMKLNVALIQTPRHTTAWVFVCVCGGGWRDCLLRQLIHCNAADVCFSLQIQHPFTCPSFYLFF